MKIIYLLLFSLVSQVVFGQITYYDALLLKSKMNNEKITIDPTVLELLTIYYETFPDLNTQDKIDEFFSKNPFFRDNTDSTKSIFLLPGLQSSSSGYAKDKIGKVGGLDITTIANGVADVMIQRAKEELTISFFNKLKKYSEKNPEFQILFPKTAENLINLLSHTYPQMLPVLREGFQEDLNMLIYHLEDVFNLPKYKPILDEFPEIKVFTELLAVMKEIEGKNAAEIIDIISRLQTWSIPGSSDGFKNAGAAVKLANIISQSLRNTSPDKIWVSSAEIKTLVDDDALFRIYMGLIYQQISSAGLQFYDDGTSFDVARSIKNNALTIFMIKNKLKDFGIVSSKVEETVSEIKRKTVAKEKITTEDYYNYINTSLDAIDFVFGVVKVFDQRFSPDKYLSVARKSNSIYKNIYLKNYAAAVADVVDVFDEIGNILEAKKSRMSTGHQAELKNLCAFLNKVRPFAVFIAGVADAKSSEDVKVALENAMLPVGSSSIKKYTKNNLSVQSYLGAYWTPSPSSDASSIWSNRFGVIAPIGLSYTPGFLSWRKGGSLSLFVPLFDIAAIVDYKLKQETIFTEAGTPRLVVTKDYSIKLGQIVSPGAYLVYGSFGNLPLALGGGFQYGPGLSKIDAANNTIVENPSLRWNIFLSVDLPFFNIINKTKYRKIN